MALFEESFWCKNTISCLFSLAFFAVFQLKTNFVFETFRESGKKIEESLVNWKQNIKEYGVLLNNTAFQHVWFDNSCTTVGTSSPSQIHLLNSRASWLQSYQGPWVSSGPVAVFEYINPGRSSVKCGSTACKKGHFLLTAITSIHQLFVTHPCGTLPLPFTSYPVGSIT